VIRLIRLIIDELITIIIIIFIVMIKFVIIMNRLFFKLIFIDDLIDD
jgi:hypothetical protein